MRKLNMEELHRKTKEEFKQAHKFPVVAVLENIRSAYNVGSVLRTADAFLLEAVVTCGYTAHPPHKQISKTALGAEHTVATQHFSTTKEAIEFLRKKEFSIWAVEQVEHSKLLYQFALPTSGIAVIFGNEVSGIEPSTLELCDGCIEIPQWGMKHSLNISVAAGIILWELVKQQLKPA